MEIHNKRPRRGARGTNRGRGETTPLRDDSDDPEYTDAVIEGTEKTYEPEGEQE